VGLARVRGRTSGAPPHVIESVSTARPHVRGDRVRTALSVIVVVALAGCGDEPAEERAAVATPAAHRVVEGERGLEVELPDGWQRAGATLTPRLTDPVEVLAVGTFPLREGGDNCSHMAERALTEIGARDAFVTLLERGYDRGSTWPDFPPRPQRFGPGLGGPSEASACVPGSRFTDHWFGFTDAGRHFHVLVAFGPEAPPAVRDQAWAVLDSLRIDPSIQPDWRASG
jgi:hypothetical protein